MESGARSGAVSTSHQEAGGSLLAFFVFAYALMWACFISVAVAIPARSLLGRSLLLLGAFAPSLSAIFIVSRSEGRSGVVALLRSMVQWQVGARWYVFAISYIAVIKLSAALILRGATGSWPRFGSDPLYLIPFAIVFSTPFQAGEELGWRGYALPRLAQRFGLARASLLLGLIWACWHLPQFFIAEADTYKQSFPVFILQVTAISVAMAFLWERTNGSVLLTMLMHSAINNSKDIVPSATSPGAIFGLSASAVAWTTVLLLWICAAYLLVRMSGKNNVVGALIT